MKTRITLLILVALLAGCATTPLGNPTGLPANEETNSSIEMNRYPKSAESRN